MNVDKSFKVQFISSNNSYPKIQLNKVTNNFKTKNTTQDSTFKTQIDSSDNICSDTTFTKTNSSFEPKLEITPIEQDVYYDEIIYYDGGGVDGWL